MVPISIKGAESFSYTLPTNQHAIREATVCSANIRAAMNDAPLQRFAFAGLGTMAALGHHRGVAQILGLRQSGFFAWLV